MYNLLVQSNRHPERLYSLAGGIIMMITYGHRVTSDNDEFVELSEELAQTSMHFPGSQMVDILPIRTWALFCSDHPDTLGSSLASQIYTTMVSRTGICEKGILRSRACQEDANEALSAG